MDFSASVDHAYDKKCNTKEKSFNILQLVWVPSSWVSSVTPIVCNRSWVFNNENCFSGQFIPDPLFLILKCSIREGNDNPLQYSCLENPMGRGLGWGYSTWDHKELDTWLVTKQQKAVEQKLDCQKELLWELWRCRFCKLTKGKEKSMVGREVWLYPLDLGREWNEGRPW